MDNSMSPADIAALTGNGMNEGSWIWFLLIFVLLGLGGNRGPAPAPMTPPNVATTEYVQSAINNQTINQGLNNIALSSANNNYETAQIINGQTNALTQQNYANQINAIQGFNNVTTQLMNQTNALGSKIDQLGYQMTQCCSSIKTQMLQDRLDDRNRQLLEAQNNLSNARQSQYLLGNMGRFVAWEGSGAATTSAVAG